jgi:hypothetical protein
LTRSLDPLWKTLSLDIFLYPEKYSTPLPIDQIVADTKVDAEGVTRYREQLAAGKPLRPIVVVKHPRKDLYAVVDGHHRFFAHVACGLTQIECAVIQDFTGFMFQLSKDGWLQPHPAVTRHVRVPILEFHDRLDQTINRELRQTMKQFLADFNRNPEQLLERLREGIEQTWKAE